MKTLLLVVILAGSALPAVGHAAGNSAKQAGCFSAMAARHVAPALRDAPCSPTLHR